MISAIIKSTMQDDTLAPLRTSPRSANPSVNYYWLLDSRAYPTKKAPEMSPIEAQQVLAQVSALLAELDSSQAATGWAKKAASYKRKVISYLTKGLLIYISKPTSTTATGSVENTGAATGQLSLQGSDPALLGESASASSKMDEKATAEVATADLLGVASTQISTSTTGPTVVKTTEEDPVQTSSQARNGSKAEASPTGDLSTPFLPVTCVSPSPQSAFLGPINREQASKCGGTDTSGAGEQCASESGVSEALALSLAEIGESKKE
jgi:hypothetical protein